MGTDANEGVKNIAVFFKAYHYYINTNRGLFRLLRLVDGNTASLGIIDWETPLLSHGFRNSRIYKLSVIAILFLVAQVKKSLQRHHDYLRLPNLGEIAILCFPHHVRIFDLARSRVTNLCDEDDIESTQQFAAIIDVQRQLGEMGVAPKLFLNGETNNCYVEELIDGTPLHKKTWWEDREMFTKISRQAVLIQKARPSRKVKALEIVDELISCVENLTSNCETQAKRTSCEWLVNTIHEVLSIIDPEKEMELFISHGDLARRNVLVNSDRNIAFIDWQTIDYRTKDYDVYNYHLSIVKDGVGEILSERKVFEFLNSALNLKHLEDANKRLSDFSLLCLLTRVKYFVLPAVSNADRQSGALAQIKDYVGVIDAYRGYCSSTLVSEG